MKIVTVVGARPQFVKAATVSRAIVEFNESNPITIEEIIVHTGQHYDQNMSDVFFEEMSIPKPKYHLNVGGGSHGEMTGEQLIKIEKVLLTEQPDFVLVYGDTNSTIAGALAAAKLHIPVAHVEAGLRSFNMNMPEEINRILTDKLAKLLFCPTSVAVANLKNEGTEFLPGKVIRSGDVMLDAAMFYKAKAAAPKSLKTTKPFILTTIHRAENTDNPDRLLEIVSALNELSSLYDIVLPIHPRTRKVLSSLNIDLSFKIIDPVSYFEMIWLIENCHFVMTDSGGLQKEAYFFNKYCITLRDQTEWVELVDAGVNCLVGASRTKIVQAVNAVDQNLIDFSNELYGDGKASQEIVRELVREILSDA